MESNLINVVRLVRLNGTACQLIILSSTSVAISNYDKVMNNAIWEDGKPGGWEDGAMEIREDGKTGRWEDWKMGRREGGKMGSRYETSQDIKTDRLLVSESHPNKIKHTIVTI